MSKWSAWPCDEIKDPSEIRQRHARDEASSSLWERNPYVMHRDREWLLAEIEKLRADNERLHNEDTKTRHALKGWVYVPPDGGAEPTHERVAAVVAEAARMREENERLRGVLDQLARLGNEPNYGNSFGNVMARNALEGKP